jgi:hypothetical protein
MKPPHCNLPNSILLCAGLFLGLFTLASAGVGYAQTCTPGTGTRVTVHPGDNVQSIVNTNPCGSTFIFAPGTYSNVTIFPVDETNHPIDGDSFVGQNSRTSAMPSILYGGTTIKSFTRSGPYWVGNIQTTPAPASGSNYRCDSKHPACLLPEDLFFSGKLYLRVTTKAAVVSGSWYLDYTTGGVYLVNNPAGHTVEASITHFAIYAANVANVTISNLIVDKYASPGGYGAISGVDPTGASTLPTFKWQVQNVEVRNCHGAGVWLGNQMAVTQSFLHNNGEFGLAGTGNNITFNNNEVSFNNLVGFLPEVGGGTKFSNILNLTAQNNNIHDNLGPGLWDDTSSTSVTYASNTLKNNRVAGIFHEIGGTADIHDNTVTNDGIDNRGAGYWYGAGIMISNSNGVNVHNNTVINSQNGIMEQARNRPDCASPCYLQNVKVYSNSITQDHAVKANTIATGILVQKSYPLGNGVYTSSGNTFGIDPTGTPAPNTYTLRPSTDPFFIWLQNTVPNSAIRYSQWQADGNN